MDAGYVTYLTRVTGFGDPVRARQAQKILTGLLAKEATHGHHVPGTPYEFRHGWIRRGPEELEAHIRAAKTVKDLRGIAREHGVHIPAGYPTKKEDIRAHVFQSLRQLPGESEEEWAAKLTDQKQRFEARTTGRRTADNVETVAPTGGDSTATAPTTVESLKRGDYARVEGIDQYGKKTTLTGYVLDPPNTYHQGRGKNRRQLTGVAMAETPDGANGWRGTVYTEPGATVSHEEPAIGRERGFSDRLQAGTELTGHVARDAQVRSGWHEGDRLTHRTRGPVTYLGHDDMDPSGTAGGGGAQWVTIDGQAGMVSATHLSGYVPPTEVEEAAHRARVRAAAPRRRKPTEPANLAGVNPDVQIEPGRDTPTQIGEAAAASVLAGMPRTAADHRARLAAFTNRDEARAYVAPLKGKELTALARDLHVDHYRTVAQRRDAIVEATVGARVDAESIRGGRWMEPHADRMARIHRVRAQQAAVDRQRDIDTATVASDVAREFSAQEAITLDSGMSHHLAADYLSERVESVIADARGRLRDGGELPGGLDEVEAAAAARDLPRLRNAVDRLAAGSNVTLRGTPYGKVRYNPAVHSLMAGEVAAGDPVMVMHPGAVLHRGGERIQLEPARVVPHGPGHAAAQRRVRATRTAREKEAARHDRLTALAVGQAEEYRDRKRREAETLRGYAEQVAADRAQGDIDAKRPVAEFAARLDEIATNGASEKALRHTIETAATSGVISPAERDGLLAAVARARRDVRSVVGKLAERPSDFDHPDGNYLDDAQNDLDRGESLNAAADRMEARARLLAERGPFDDSGRLDPAQETLVRRLDLLALKLRIADPATKARESKEAEARKKFAGIRATAGVGIHWGTKHGQGAASDAEYRWLQSEDSAAVAADLWHQADVLEHSGRQGFLTSDTNDMTGMLLHDQDTRNRAAILDAKALRRLAAAIEDAGTLRTAQTDAVVPEGLAASLDSLRAAHGLTAVGGRPGERTTMDHSVHESIAGNITTGSPVDVIRPGHTVALPNGETATFKAAVQAAPADVSPRVHAQALRAEADRAQHQLDASLPTGANTTRRRHTPAGPITAGQGLTEDGWDQRRREQQRISELRAEADQAEHTPNALPNMTAADEDAILAMDRPGASAHIRSTAQAIRTRRAEQAGDQAAANVLAGLAQPAKTRPKVDVAEQAKLIHSRLTSGARMDTAMVLREQPVAVLRNIARIHGIVGTLGGRDEVARMKKPDLVREMLPWF